ncbi:MAG: hypothetical protein QNJ55_02970 [Xenococcus sp. MO_188.B8]|nr:hypothetical protein [Xenococcus sp. MO_188.B8]
MDTKSALEIKNLDIFEEISFNDSEKLVGGALGAQRISSGNSTSFVGSLDDLEINPLRRRTFRFSSPVKNYQKYRRNTVVWGNLGSPKVPYRAWFPIVGLV